MCDVVNLEFFNDKLATTGSAWKIFYFPCHAYLTYSNCDSLSCSKTGPQCTALLKFICAFTRFVNIQVVWSRTVLFIQWTYVAKSDTFSSKFFKKVVVFWEGQNNWQSGFFISNFVAFSELTFCWKVENENKNLLKRLEITITIQNQISNI